MILANLGGIKSNIEWMVNTEYWHIYTSKIIKLKFLHQYKNFHITKILDEIYLIRIMSLAYKYPSDTI